jgi:hypothetical protein
MKNILTSLVASIVLFFASGCEREKKPYVPVQRCPDLTRNMDTISKYIHGTWEWLEEMRIDRYSGIQYFTPNTPGWYSLTVKLSNDTAKFFVNNFPDSVFQFRIQKWMEITNYPTDSIPVIAYYSFYTGVRRNAIPIMICKDQLLMQNQLVSSIFGENVWRRK